MIYLWLLLGYAALFDIRNDIPIKRGIENCNQTVKYLSCQRQRTWWLGVGFLIDFSFRKDTEINADTFFFEVVRVGELPLPDSSPAAVSINQVCVIFH